MNENSDYARSNFLKEYKKKYGSYLLTDYNKGRHYFIEGKVKIWFLYKNEPLHSFNYLAKDFILKYPQLQGEGDCINKKCLAIAVNRGCKYIVFAEKNNKYLYADPRELLLLCTENKDLSHTQGKENTYKQSGGTIAKFNEDTFIFPLKFLKEWKWDLEEQEVLK